MTFWRGKVTRKLTDCFTHQPAAHVGLIVRWFAHDQPVEAAFDPADGFPADASLTRQGGRCSKHLASFMPPMKTLFSMSRSVTFFCGDECADVAMQFASIVKAAVDDRMRVPFSKIEVGRFTTS